jgi:acylphosphatase
MSEGHAARRLRIRGLVQGVGFRWSMLQEARRLGIHGWVRNRRDGSVEAVVAGPVLALAALVAWAKRGPPGSSVDGVEESPEAGPVEPGFQQRPTE